MSGYSKGTKREHDAADLYEENGWVTIRSAGSHGPADFAAMKSGRQTELVQVKATKAGPWSPFPPAEREELRTAAITAGARPVYCWWPPDRKGPRFYHAGDWPNRAAA